VRSGHVFHQAAERLGILYINLPRSHFCVYDYAASVGRVVTQINQDIDLPLSAADTPGELRVGRDAHISMYLLN
jgi:hypothetical protein